MRLLISKTILRVIEMTHGSAFSLHCCINPQARSPAKPQESQGDRGGVGPISQSC